MSLPESGAASCLRIIWWYAYVCRRGPQRPPSRLDALRASRFLLYQHSRLGLGNSDMRRIALLVAALFAVANGSARLDAAAQTAGASGLTGEYRAPPVGLEIENEKGGRLKIVAVDGLDITYRQPG